MKEEVEEVKEEVKEPIEMVNEPYEEVKTPCKAVEDDLMKTPYAMMLGDIELESITESVVRMKQPQDSATHLQETPFSAEKMLQ